MEKVLIALIGILGVIIGAGLTAWREWWMDKRRSDSDAKYLAIRVICLLDTFIQGCCDVVEDDGTSFGQVPPDGPEPQVDTPKLNFDSLQVNWNGIPTNLMHKILSLPNKIDFVNYLIHSTWEHQGMEEVIDDRQNEYTKLGLEAFDIVKSLCKKYDIKEELFEERKYRIDRLREFRINSLKT
jgi:hypothetical protein